MTCTKKIIIIITNLHYIHLVGGGGGGGGDNFLVNLILVHVSSKKNVPMKIFNILIEITQTKQQHGTNYRHRANIYIYIYIC